MIKLTSAQGVVRAVKQNGEWIILVEDSQGKTWSYPAPNPPRKPTPMPFAAPTSN